MVTYQTGSTYTKLVANLFIVCAEILALLLKNNRNIKGMMLNRFGFVLSQYADDTPLMLDGTERSLYNTFKVLKFYANIRT